MDLFLIPLGFSFLFLLASTFTAAYSRKFGKWAGQVFSTVTRNLLGLPLLAVAFALTARGPSLD